MEANDDEDARTVELETLEAIFPELRRLEPRGFSFELELPVAPAAPVTVLFPAATANPQVAPVSAAAVVAGAAAAAAAAAAAPAAEDSLQVTHLPPLSCRIVLPDGYPAERAPEVKISTTPQWLSSETVTRLEEDAPRLWEEMGRDLIAFTYIDHVQRAADDVFGAITSEGNLEIHPDHKLAVLDYDIKAKRAAFEKESFECGVCLDPKKGSKCHKMLDCGHIFCLQCLQDFYEDAIQAGNISTVRCLAPNCAKKRADAAKATTAAGGKPTKKPKTFISPSELLQVGLSDEMVRRYVNLKYKTELESDKNTVYCPRRWCNGAARSKRHKKPSGLDFAEASCSESDADADEKGSAEDEKKNKNKKLARKFNTADLLSVCEDCGFAFCSRCFQSWHGEFYHCAPRREDGELTEEDKASLVYLKLHTSPCPTCNAPAQKTMGCNHMICSRCDSHFCYLCSAWLDAENPYQHYNQQPNGKVTSCYMRLWELEGGDGDDVGLGFAGGEGGVGGRGAAAAHPADQHDREMVGFPDIEIIEVVEEEEEEEERGGGDLHQNRDGDIGHGPDEVVHRGNQQHNAVAVAREAPLVLRLMDNHNMNQNRAQNQARGAAVANRPRGNAARQRGGGAGQANLQDNHRQGRGGARGGPRGARGGRPRGRQNQNQNQNQRQGQGLEQDIWRDAGAAAEQLDAPMEAWIRRFVEMALADAEDQIEEGESDEEHDMIIID
ncbi:E3 ubiquitin-protein ligase itt1 [Escovopsis weberi]|uniref:RBR-type E3 ubiquitin transferase n=1 Tax=Escovopsis weberi TaxID=150374 RepID=A0A0M9VTW9_ESCWE|nr:E3 ubiquitin-protein ligase itt1 [Escovopsis weberi]